MRIDLTCPSCGKTGPAASNLVGKKIRCKVCGESFVAGGRKVATALERPIGSVVLREKASQLADDDTQQETVVSEPSNQRNTARSYGLIQFLVGLGMVAVGGLITLFSYNSARPGGNYTVMFGLIGFGIFSIFVGLVRAIYGKM